MAALVYTSIWGKFNNQGCHFNKQGTDNLKTHKITLSSATNIPFTNCSPPLPSSNTDNDSPTSKF